MRITAWMLCPLVAMLAACSHQPRIDQMEGQQVVVRTDDGRLVAGQLVKADADTVVLKRADGGDTSIERHAVAAVAKPAAPRDGSGLAHAELDSERVSYREVTVPAGTTLRVKLDDALGSDVSRVEDQVRASLAQPISRDGADVVPAGSRLTGTVTAAQPSAKVKGRARLAFRFDELAIGGRGERLQIDTRPVVVEAAGTKQKDAEKIGIGAAAGALIGGLMGGGGGAAKGALIGGGAGTAAVLTTRGDEVHLAQGTAVDVRLAQPLTFQVPAGPAAR